mmetsp:Transcript_23242/g.53104  ORF Transcript_23242/g.53104 Transcript_23242/m.53104 type:complete len:209 (-) Transcript_23242:489-1115(-)
MPAPGLHQVLDALSPVSPHAYQGPWPFAPSANGAPRHVLQLDKPPSVPAPPQSLRPGPVRAWLRPLPLVQRGGLQAPLAPWHGPFPRPGHNQLPSVSASAPFPLLPPVAPPATISPPSDLVPSPLSASPCIQPRLSVGAVPASLGIFVLPPPPVWCGGWRASLALQHGHLSVPGYERETCVPALPSAPLATILPPSDSVPSSPPSSCV